MVCFAFQPLPGHMPFGKFLYLSGFPSGSGGKESAYNVGDPGLIPGSERYPGEGNGNSLQYSCRENSRDRVAWQAPVHGSQSWTQLSDLAHTHKSTKVGVQWWMDKNINRKWIFINLNEM